MATTNDHDDSASQPSAGRTRISTPTMKEDAMKDASTNVAVSQSQETSGSESGNIPSREGREWTRSTGGIRSKKSIFSLPAPVKRVFDLFPIHEYEANELPLRSQRRNRGQEGGNAHMLYVFTTEEDARRGRPSYNPGCLKWQTYLLFNNVDFELIASSNHASPSGSLPFLQPGRRSRSASSASTDTDTATPDPIPANRLRKWLAKQKQHQQQQIPSDPANDTDTDPDIRAEAYKSLIDNRIRKLWLYQLYLAPQNDRLLQKLYVEPCSRNSLVRYTITRQLRAAAAAELVKSSASNIVDVEILIREASEAWEALSVLLGEDTWFFGRERPGEFDAGVFAFSHLVLDHRGLMMGWEYNPLGEGLRRCENLVGHEGRIGVDYFGEGLEGGGEGARPGVHARTTSTLGKRKTLRG